VHGLDPLGNGFELGKSIDLSDASPGPADGATVGQEDGVPLGRGEGLMEGAVDGPVGRGRGCPGAGDPEGLGEINGLSASRHAFVWLTIPMTVMITAPMTAARRDVVRFMAGLPAVPKFRGEEDRESACRGYGLEGMDAVVKERHGQNSELAKMQGNFSPAATISASFCRKLFDAMDSS
jgi:hypothetical protein